MFHVFTSRHRLASSRWLERSAGPLHRQALSPCPSSGIRQSLRRMQSLSRQLALFSERKTAENKIELPNSCFVVLTNDCSGPVGKNEKNGRLGLQVRIGGICWCFFPLNRLLFISNVVRSHRRRNTRQIWRHGINIQYLRWNIYTDGSRGVKNNKIENRVTIGHFHWLQEGREIRAIDCNCKTVLLLKFEIVYNASECLFEEPRILGKPTKRERGSYSGSVQSLHKFWVFIPIVWSRALWKKY